MMESVRLRLVFDHILGKLHKTQGLKRCWILLKPQLRSISDLSSYLLHAFNLQNDCPHGLILSMEGFALPPFESTSILKDKDIIQVEKNGGVSSEVVMVGDKTISLDVVKIVETQPVAADMNLLANEEFEKESGGYRSEEEEDAPEQVEDIGQVENAPKMKNVSKKRKASKELKSSKRKKTKSGRVEKLAVAEDIGNNVCGEQNGTLSNAEVDERIENSKARPIGKRLPQPQGNGNGTVDATSTLSGTNKLPSRSARRKKAKRQWLREKLKAERKEQHRRQLGKKGDRHSSEKDNWGGSQESAENGNQDVPEVVSERDDEKIQECHQQLDQDSDVEDDVVPIVIRPGHIRFGSLRKDADQAAQQNQIPLETFQWNGTTNKKKGQKWGKEKVASYKRNDFRNVNQECSRSRSYGARQRFNHVDFDKLEFYASLPKEGDVIAYRLIELSSSWTPQLSSYRVGRILRYDVETNRVRLVSVPEYPMVPAKEMGDDASAVPSETSYARDGSLWIEFSSLVEVRLVTPGNINSGKSIAGACVRGQDTDIETGTKPDNGNEAHASAQENGEVNAWEKINRALNAKKEQLSQEDNWNKPQSSGRRPWSYKAMRGSALGPTVALLRAQNEL